MQIEVKSQKQSEASLQHDKTWEVMISCLDVIDSGSSLPWF